MKSLLKKIANVFKENDIHLPICQETGRRIRYTTKEYKGMLDYPAGVSKDDVWKCKNTGKVYIRTWI